MANTYYFVGTCPGEGCTRESFKKAGCWGWTEAEARSRLTLHLQRSSFHELDYEDAKLLAETADVQTDTHVPSRKRPRQPDNPPPEREEEPIYEEPPVDVLALPADGANITMSRVNYQSIIDSVARASTAVKHAARLSAAAARAFQDESTVLDNVKHTLETIVANSEVAGI
jgi:hypothetical protein